MGVDVVVSYGKRDEETVPRNRRTFHPTRWIVGKPWKGSIRAWTRKMDPFLACFGCMERGSIRLKTVDVTFSLG